MREKPEDSECSVVNASVLRGATLRRRFGIVPPALYQELQHEETSAKKHVHRQ